MVNVPPTVPALTLTLASARLPLNVPLPLKTFGIVAVPAAVTTSVAVLSVPVALTVSVVLTAAACAIVPRDSAKAQNPIIAFIPLYSPPAYAGN
jgi:hypothetical protein